jgi:hypothetical protein
MSQIANIAVYDGAATPVLHTLIPVSVTRESGKVTAEYRENAASVPTIAQVTCTLSLSVSKNGVYKVENRTVVPVMETVSGQNAGGYTAAPKIAYSNTVVTTGFFHERSDSAGRRLVRQLALNIDGNVGTSVAPVTTGPIPELFDLLVAPT